MPLITFTGLPCSGKTKWAKELISELEKRVQAAQESKGPGHNYKVVYHSDETLGLSHDSYRESVTEKSSRGAQMSAVKRDLSRTSFVILDSLSYIKGFRYQLFCEAKGVVTPHCVIHVVSSLEKCMERNEQNGSQWDPELIKQLQMRYEEPKEDARWDSPLFTLVSDFDDEKLPVDEIWDALVLKRAPPPNAATLVKPTSNNDYLQQLDKVTQEVITKILQHQQLLGGGQVRVSDGLTIDLPVNTVSTPQLQRIRRTFISLNKMRHIDSDRISTVFVDYVNASFNNED
ncbi:hypothetical protein FT663_01759 [Candidozyma haemuli var. vulneris]|uniref:Protein KTI12 n=1 Tax=Candidozyma haemuli TaxID=45357 RepID=A0A2V1AQN4_9ASCO|nr:hypothetical protein CXQ85_002331 [[Candida] haemuloni]KAF3989515.1 hypothetical protein FT662_02784 [[Candida] haemuloni var. vulneris]KAF3993770.1 hypothetical protein FT663_01759 [[Candida] haemuloni var. vulneris]PVH20537.1 hypothetical protein CXQ85_002331 [[Candida] haemuloni]